jgi:hypothetical protein
MDDHLLACQQIFERERALFLKIIDINDISFVIIVFYSVNRNANSMVGIETLFSIGGNIELAFPLTL